MSRVWLFPPLILVVMWVLGPPAPAAPVVLGGGSSWSSTYQSLVGHSLLPMTMAYDDENGVTRWWTTCTAVVVRSQMVVGEKHCLLPEQHTQRVGGHLFTLYKTQGELIALKTLGRDSAWRPIEVRQDQAQIGEPIAAIGYAWGGDHPFMTLGNVASLGDIQAMRSMPAGLDGPAPMFFNINVWIGMSGGPMVDQDGRLISLVRQTLEDADRGGNSIEASEPHASLRDFIKGLPN